MSRRVCMAVCVLVSVSTAQLHAQGPPKRVCPLSDSQLKKAQEIFAKIADVMRHPRCINCHGALDPFDKEKAGNHSGGSYKAVQDEDGNLDEEKTNAQCTKDCHANFPNWKMAPNPLFFVGLDNAGLCKLLKFPGAPAVTSKNLIGHFFNDNGGIQFIAEAFTGRRGLAGQGLDMVGDENPAPTPSITQQQLTQLVRDWVDAQGGEFQGDYRCGCEPVRDAIRLFYMAESKMVQGTMTMGPADIPITFKEDHTFEGRGTLPIEGSGSAFGFCTGQSEGKLPVKVSGTAFVDEKKDEVKLQLTNSFATGFIDQRCRLPMGSGEFDLQGGDKAIINFGFDGHVGKEKATPFPLPGPVAANLHVTIVEQSQAASPK